jgi:predicted 3-demethylubiquinone-9 3-methyltransferase (glyoxalase superfamily)
MTIDSRFSLVSLLIMVFAAVFPACPGSALGGRTQGEPVVSKKQKITPFLWFDQNAEEAVRFYTSVFKNSKVLEESRWGEGGPVPKGTLMTARFQIDGQEIIALNGGPRFKLNEAFSLLVSCESQAEVDELWAKLGAGGEESMCGWIKDKYGLWWQIIPTALPEMLQDKDPARVQRVTAAMLKMRKLDIARLKQAWEAR